MPFHHRKVLHSSRDLVRYIIHFYSNGVTIQFHSLVCSRCSCNCDCWHAADSLSCPYIARPS